MTSFLKECRAPGCHNLTKGVYCSEHKASHESSYKPAKWKVKFYSSYKWNQCSLKYRQAHPLCVDCEKEGRVTTAEMVHHNPELRDLLDRGWNPYSWEYLEGLCNDCHATRHNVWRPKKRVQGEGLPLDIKSLLLGNRG